MAVVYRHPPPLHPLIPKYLEAIESPDDTKGSLTFGVELEFLVPFSRKDIDDPFPDEKRPLFGYRDILKADITILDAITNHCDIEFRTDLEDEFHPPYRNIIRYDEWRILRDLSVKFRKEECYHYRWVGREITSEVLKSDDPEVYTEKITKVCRAMRQLRVHLNDTTAVHVHVGLGDEPFSLLTIKKVITLILFVDDMLMGLHHPARRTSAHCRLVSRCSTIGRLEHSQRKTYDSLITRSLEHGMAEFIPDVADANQLLQATDSIVELARMMDDPLHFCYYRGSISFAKFLPVDEVGGNTQTIEFRQMAGCLDPDQIIHWVKVCIGIVDFARLSNGGQYKGLIGKLMAKESTFSVFDFLSELGLVEEEKHFRAKVEGYKSNPDFYPGESSGSMFVPELD
ncbi:putative amidoligase enzyme-domain-containing protein [Annulohypoxylon maeteangense]|uniref:putative amidoligase enzyme-domain-containing protein n=1 Tax=Annulohypoxylon maeteangense TaxID=1927788 RepID=UPI002008D026|nr:putative amidoligase enzyme-domain-containing protein [Annulohypoxylon maeteangense]KAI0888280.1 putative amidoligase enzyme-domain-containing protein [Annulohypoxylon maeteangense]